MKKLQSIVLVLVVAFLASCSGGSLESMVKDYEKACEKGNIVKIEKIKKQIQEKYPEGSPEWTDELMERILVATENAMDVLEDEAEEMYDDAMDEAIDMYDDAMKDAKKVAGEMYDDAMKEAEKMMDEAIEEAEDMMDEAMSEVW